MKLNKFYTAVIHQPHFFPWLGYYNKLHNADIYIAQDNVQFRRRYFQNRTLLKNTQNEPMWFTVPVHAHQTTLIKDVTIADRGWNLNLLSFLRHSYSKSLHYNENIDFIKCLVLDKEFTYLLDLNIHLLHSLSEYLRISFEMEQAIHYKKQGCPTEDLVYLCLQNEANRYLFGEGGGIKYHGTSMFKKNNIVTVQQSFHRKFCQINEEIYPSSDRMSILHYLFEIGKSDTENIVKNTWGL